MTIPELIKLAKTRLITQEDIEAIKKRMEVDNDKYEAKELYQLQHEQEMLNRVYSI